MAANTKAKQGSVKLKNLGYVFVCLVVLLTLSFGARQVYATDPGCTTTSQGDTICGKTKPANEATPATAKKTPTSGGTGGTIVNGGGPLLGDTGGTVPTDKALYDDLKAVLNTFPDVIKNALFDQSLTYFEQNQDSKKKQELLKKLKAFSDKVKEVSDKQCGYPKGATDNDYKQYINNSIATSIQNTKTKFADMSAEEMDKLLKNLESSVCSTMDLGGIQNVPGYGPVATNDYIQNNQNDGADAAGGKSIPAGSPASAYAPGSLETLNPDKAYPNVQGSGGQLIANCAKQMIGYTTADNPGTQGGNLGCALAVSRILDCAQKNGGGGKYSVGTHLGTGELYDALKSSGCYTIVHTGFLKGFQMQPGDVLVTKRGSRAGHTGVFFQNGIIISNSSGSGTIKENFNTVTWDSGVTSRNPGGSAVFRRTCQ